MSQIGQDPFVQIPATLNILVHPDYRSSYLEVYLSIRSRASLSPTSDNFARSFPSIETIGERFRHTRTTVCEAIAWLEANGYLYKQRRRRDSNLYTLVLRRDWFLELRRSKSQEHAEQAYENWLGEQQVGARSSNSAAAGGLGRRNLTSTALKSPGKDFKGNAAAVNSPASETSRALPSEMSSPADPDLDQQGLKPLTIKTSELDVGGKTPTAPLLLSPFFRRKGFMDLDQNGTSKDWDKLHATAKAKAVQAIEEEEAKKKGGA